MTGGLSGGIAKFAGGYIPEGFGYQLAGRSLIGGVTGGITSEIYGESFGDGFSYGAGTAAFGYIFNEWYHDAAKGAWKAISRAYHDIRYNTSSVPLRFEQFQLDMSTSNLLFVIMFREGL
jgi:hypothetical protein